MESTLLLYSESLQNKAKTDRKVYSVSDSLLQLKFQKSQSWNHHLPALNKQEERIREHFFCQEGIVVYIEFLINSNVSKIMAFI